MSHMKEIKASFYSDANPTRALHSFMCSNTMEWYLLKYEKCYKTGFTREQIEESMLALKMRVKVSPTRRGTLIRNFVRILTSFYRYRFDRVKFDLRVEKLTKRKSRPRGLKKGVKTSGTQK